MNILITYSIMIVKLNMKIFLHPNNKNNKIKITVKLPTHIKLFE